MPEEDEGTVTEHTARIPDVLDDPLRNRGVAFTQAERGALGLTGRVPAAVMTLEEQARRAWAQLQGLPTDLAKNDYLEQLHDRNEVLYYKVLGDHLASQVDVSAPGAALVPPVSNLRAVRPLVRPSERP